MRATRPDGKFRCPYINGRKCNNAVVLQLHCCFRPLLKEERCLSGPVVIRNKAAACNLHRLCEVNRCHLLIEYDHCNRINHTEPLTFGIDVTVDGKIAIFGVNQRQHFATIDSEVELAITPGKRPPELGMRNHHDAYS